MKLHGLYFQPPLKNNYFGHIIGEIYKDRFYDPYLQGKKDLTILDLGANVGIFSYYASEFAKVVYAVEPAQEHFETLNHMLKQNEITNVKPFQFAVSNQDGEENFYHYENKTMYSLYGNIQGVNQTGFEKVPLKRLDTFFKEQNIEHVDLMKLDIEGVEYEVLGGDGFGNIADKVDCVLGEMHSWAGRNPNQIKEAFVSRGFKFEWFPHDAQLFRAYK